MIARFITPQSHLKRQHDANANLLSLEKSIPRYVLSPFANSPNLHHVWQIYGTSARTAYSVLYTANVIHLKTLSNFQYAVSLVAHTHTITYIRPQYLDPNRMLCTCNDNPSNRHIPSCNLNHMAIARHRS